MDIHVREGTSPNKMKPHHHHSCHPEEEDIKPVQVLRLGKTSLTPQYYQPAKGRKRPQGRAEPGVEHIGLLSELCVPAVVAGFWFILATIMLPHLSQTMQVCGVPTISVLILHSHGYCSSSQNRHSPCSLAVSLFYRSVPPLLPF